MNATLKPAHATQKEFGTLNARERTMNDKWILLIALVLVLQPTNSASQEDGTINPEASEDVELAEFKNTLLNADSDHAIRQLKVLQASGKSQSAVETLVESLKTGNKPTRLLAALCLAQMSDIKDEQIAELRTVFMRENTNELRIALGVPIAEHDPLNAMEVIPLMVDALPNIHDDFQIRIMNILSKLNVLSPQAKAALNERLKDENKLVRANAYRVLAVVDPQGTHRHVPLLMLQLDDDDISVRCQAMLALGFYRENAISSVDRLVQIVNDEHKLAVERAAAVVSLSIIAPKDTRVITVINAWVERADPTLQITAIKSIKFFGPDAITSVPVLLKILATSSDSNVKIAVAEALSEIGPRAQAALWPLIKLTSDRDKAVTSAARAALDRLSTRTIQTAINELSMALDENNRKAAEAACQVISGLGITSAVQPLLVESLRTSGAVNAQRRSLAAQCVNSIGRGDRNVIDALKQSLGDSDRYVALHSAMSLCTIAPAESDIARQVLHSRLESLDEQERVTSAIVLLKIETSDRNAAAATVKNLLSRDQTSNLALLGAASIAWNDAEHVDANVVSALVYGLQSADAAMRKHAASALGASGAMAMSGQGELVRVMRTDMDAQVRAAATSALARVQPNTDRAVEAIGLALSNDPHEEVRRAAAEAFGLLGARGDDVRQKLETSLLSDSDALVRSKSAYALTRLRPEVSNLSALAKAALSDTSSEVRYQATCAIGQQTGGGSLIIAAMKTALKDKDARVRQQAATNLGQMGPLASSALPELIDILDGAENYFIRLSAASAIGSMGSVAHRAVAPLTSNLVNDLDSRARLFGVTALGNIRHVAAVDPLRKALFDQSPEVAAAAALALGKIGPDARPAIDQLGRLVNDPVPVVVRAAAADALGQIGFVAEPAAPALLKSVRGAPAPVRCSSINALARIRPSGANGIMSLLQSAENIATEQSNQVQDAIANALILWLPYVDDVALVPALTSARDALKSMPSEEPGPIANSILMLDRTINRLGRPNWWTKVIESILSMPEVWGPIAYLLFFLLFWRALLLLQPIWVFHINEFLEREVVKEVPFLKWLSAIPFLAPVSSILKAPGVTLQIATLAAFYHYHPRVLDAWLEIPANLMRKAIEGDQIAAIAHRQIHVPTFVKRGHRPSGFDNREAFTPTLQHFQQVFESDITRIVVSGVGGVGKTSLACQLIRWSLKLNPRDRLCKQHVMLPIFIEHDFQCDPTHDNQPDFVWTVLGKLRQVHPTVLNVSRKLVESLLFNRRLLVVVDGLSEKTVAPSLVRGFSGESCAARALVITTRQETDLASLFQAHTNYEIGLLSMEQLSGFFLRYVSEIRESGGVKLTQLTDIEAVEASTRFIRLVRGRPVPTQLCKLYADDQIEAKATGLASHTDELPEIVLRYLNSLNRKGDQRLSDSQVHQIAKSIAYTYVKDGLRPQPLSVVRARIAAGNQVFLDYLARDLLLIRLKEPEQTRYEFLLDVIAEYLAAMYIVEDNGSSMDKWNEFFATAAAKMEARQPVETLLLAVQDCAISKQFELGIDRNVLDAIAGLTGWAPPDRADSTGAAA